MWTVAMFSVAVICADPCLQENHKELHERRRSTAYKTEDPETLLCDMYLQEGWYRFTGGAGGQMPDKCVGRLQCGTVVPIWMNGTHPTVGEGMVSRTACANFESGEADKEPCCEHTVTIGVKNCGRFYVYYLKPTPENFATSDDHNDNADNNDLTNYNDNYDLTNYNLTNDNDNYDLTNYNLTDDNDNYDLTNYDDNYDLTNYNLTNPNDNYDLTTYNNYDLTTTNNHDITNASNYNDNANHFASYFNYNPNHSNGEYDKCNGDPHNTSSSEVFLVLHVR
ncbi:hypothetical protein BaRGS_00034153 [Batillaria attramentaria]|uniref:UMOD/GP2/OIT3-like D8C domain-containing protein n=1 Tax=Batillaria attramentaria TaxID=370345 RepID=A0ABD0JIA7_9CAEN